MRTVRFIPLLLIVSLLLAACGLAEPGPVQTTLPTTSTKTGYPITGSAFALADYASLLPPPPLDALPYDVREPLFNGESVPVKKRWLWVPPGQSITVANEADAPTHVSVPAGATWWKEFYMETDRGVFLIERRLLVKVDPSAEHPNGWAFFSSYHLPIAADDADVLTLPSTSEESAAFLFNPTDWLPTQSRKQPLEIRFADVRGAEHAYVFPGDRQCSACHGGSAGHFPNDDDDPVLAFGLHPLSLTQQSYEAIVAHGWLTGADALLNPAYPDAASEIPRDFDELTTELVGLMRQNCASCHNDSIHAQARGTAFTIDPNYAYSGAELLALLDVEARMDADPFPLVTPGSLDESELWLRLNGLEGRRRMPPREGGLPELDARMIDLWRQWIEGAAELSPSALDG